MQITTGQHPVIRVVTERRGSWNYQDAFRQARYLPVKNKSKPGYHWVSVERSHKFPKTVPHRYYWEGYAKCTR